MSKQKRDWEDVYHVILQKTKECLLPWKPYSNNGKLINGYKCILGQLQAKLILENDLLYIEIEDLDRILMYQDEYDLFVAIKKQPTTALINQASRFHTILSNIKK